MDTELEVQKKKKRGTKILVKDNRIKVTQIYEKDNFAIY